jgi:hypothetical protein
MSDNEYEEKSTCIGFFLRHQAGRRIIPPIPTAGDFSTGWSE